MARARTAWPGLAVAMALVAVLSPAVGGQPDAVAELLRSHRIRPVAPPVGAPDFTLPRLTGGDDTLSQRRGRWVLLTFFATWCLPCRTEMPTLDSLHASRGGDGLELLAVSVDRRREPIAPFVSDLGLELPVVWDRSGEVGNAYQAASIPVSYLIDPAGRLVGVSRGARDWSRLGPMFDALLEMVPAGGDEPAAYAELAALPLPAALEPPTAEWSLPGPPARPGRPFPLEIRLAWSGRLEDYLPQPPRIELPEGVSAGRVAADSSSRDGLHRVRYRLELTAAGPGTYALDPIELRYLPASGEGQAAVRIPGPTVEVAATGLAARASLAAAAAAALIAALIYLRRRRSAPQAATSDPFARLPAILDRARSQRLEGDPGAAFESLLGVARELEGPQERQDLEERLQAVRFGGRLPDRGELEAVERRLRRDLEARRPDPEAERRRQLRLPATGQSTRTRKERPA